MGVEPLADAFWVCDVSREVGDDPRPVLGEPHGVRAGPHLDVPEALLLAPLAELLVSRVQLPTVGQCLPYVPPEFPLFGCGER